MSGEIPSQRDQSLNNPEGAQYSAPLPVNGTVFGEDGLPEVFNAPLSEVDIANLQRRHRALLQAVENLELQKAMIREALEEAETRALTLERENAQLARQVSVDHLTGLGSLAALDKRRDELQAILRGRASRRGQDGDIVAVMVLSLDVIGLKKANAISQFTGDQLLKDVAAAMQDRFRETDIFRRGGDEFIGLFPISSDEAFQSILDKLHDFVASEQGARVRAGYCLAYASSLSSLVEAEELADPKTHPENRIERPRKGAARMSGPVTVPDDPNGSYCP